MRGLGANLVFHGRDFDDAREQCERLAEEHGYRYVHAGNEPLLIAGVGTVALEMLESNPDLDVIFVPVGSGTGASSTCIVAKSINPKIRMIAVQAAASPAGYESWKARKLVTAPNQTFAE